MRSYKWWLGQKRRVKKKYTLFLGEYLSPKEVKELTKRMIEMKHGKEKI